MDKKTQKRRRGLPTEFSEAARARLIVAAFILLLAGGTTGYMLLERMTLLNAFYMTVITLATVGYAEVEPLTDAGKIFTVLLIFGGVGIIAYGLGSLIEFLVGGYMTGMFRRRAMTRLMHNLESHFIVCGFGRVGQAVAQELAAQDTAFVVVDQDPAAAERAGEKGYLVVTGDASDDEVLREAGIERAAGLVSTLGTDAGNVFVTLTARVVNPRLLIVARASTEETENKLARAGADHVISPYFIGGRKMATLLMKPLVSNYLDVVTGGGELEFRLEEFDLDGSCLVLGRSIQELQVRKQTGSSILAVRRRKTGRFDTNPSPELVLEQGDAIIAIGTAEEIARLERLLGCRSVTSRGDGSQPKKE